MNVTSAVKYVNKRGMLLVFPHDNRREPPSLWHEYFPRKQMRWEWDESGDAGLAQLWHLRERLSVSRKVVYGKWFRGKATLMSFEVFEAILRLGNPLLPRVVGLSREARDILDLLEEDSPLSTKQLKRLADLQGRSAESLYQRALKELWSRNLIVAFGEVDEGAFPSLAMGATKVLFEDSWQVACRLSEDQAQKIVARVFPEGSAFLKYLNSLRKIWAKDQRDQLDETLMGWSDEE
jgi:hypothetical protein